MRVMYDLMSKSPVSARDEVKDIAISITEFQLPHTKERSTLAYNTALVTTNNVLKSRQDISRKYFTHSVTKL